MNKERSLGVTIISRIEIVIGTIGLLLFTPLTIMELLNELYVYQGQSERYVGFTVDLILAITCGITLIVGKLTYQLKPLGRILHFFISLFIIICYILFLYLIKFDIKIILSDLLSDPRFIVLYIPFILSLFLIYYFSHSKVKEQFRL